MHGATAPRVAQHLELQRGQELSGLGEGADLGARFQTATALAQGAALQPDHRADSVAKIERLLWQRHSLHRKRVPMINALETLKVLSAFAT